MLAQLKIATHFTLIGEEMRRVDSLLKAIKLRGYYYNYLISQAEVHNYRPHREGVGVGGGAGGGGAGLIRFLPTSQHLACIRESIFFAELHSTQTTFNCSKI